MRTYLNTFFMKQAQYRSLLCALPAVLPHKIRRNYFLLCVRRDPSAVQCSVEAA